MEVLCDKISIKRKKLIEAQNLNLPKKSLITITGNNGTGKSLLLKNIFLKLKEQNICAVFVDQTSEHIIKNFSVLENISLSSSKRKIFLANEMLKEMNVTNLINHSSIELSGGEKKIINILRGFFSESEYVLLDEPTNELDYNSVMLLKKIIKKNILTKTIICITHDDRITEMANIEYHIVNKRISQRKLNNNKNNNKNNNNNNKLKLDNYDMDVKFISKAFQRRWISSFLILLLLLLSIFNLYFINESYKNEIPRMKDNQIEIFIPSATLSTSFFEGTLPVKYFSYINGDSSYNEMLKAFDSTCEDSINEGLNLSLYINDSEMYNKYTIELLDINSQSFFLIPELYMNNNNASIYVDNFKSDDFFEISKNVKDTVENTETQTITMNIDEYETILGEIYLAYSERPEDLKISHYILVLNEGNSFYDFIESDSFIKISKGNYFIRSNETIKIYNAIESFRNIKTVIIDTLILCVFILMTEITFCYLYMKNNKRKLKIFVNRGISIALLKKAVNKKYRVYIERGIGGFLLALVFIIFFNNQYFNISFQLVIILNFFVFMICTEYIAHKILNSQLKRHYHWRFR